MVLEVLGELACPARACGPRVGPASSLESSGADCVGVAEDALSLWALLHPQVYVMVISRRLIAHSHLDELIAELEPGKDQRVLLRL